MQNGRLSLHYAAAKGAPFAVVEALLNANRKAAITTDKACLRVQTAACAVVPPPSRAVVRGALPPPPMLHRAPRTQDEKLPLHYAATKGAPFGVMKLLLDANPKAVTEADKARS